MSGENGRMWLVGTLAIGVFVLMAISANTESSKAQRAAEKAEAARAEQDLLVAAGRIRSRGYHCGQITDLSRTAIKSNGDKLYKLTCDYAGPFYELRIDTRGWQSLRPLD